MTCNHCGIWRPNASFNIIDALSSNGRTEVTYRYCTSEDTCRLESLATLITLEGAGYIIQQSQPLTFESEETLMRRLLRLKPTTARAGHKIKCTICQHKGIWHNRPTDKGRGCTHPMYPGINCTCLQFIPDPD